MSDFEVPEPILNSPYEAPREHWHIVEGAAPQRRPGRRPAMYFYRDPKARPERQDHGAGVAIELELVNSIREQLDAWRAAGYPGASRTTIDLLGWWRREGRKQPLFFAQLEAAETVIFLVEARADFRQGVKIPREELSEAKIADGYSGFTRMACKMATGSGKTTVMAMLAAWSILNKVNGRSDSRFSDVVLVVCPNVTIRDRLRELDPNAGEASIYVTRDLVPPEMRTDLARGRVLVTNWHVFEPRSMQVGGVSAKVLKAGVRVVTTETIAIGAKTTTARGSRYLTLEDYERQCAAGMIEVIEEERDRQGNLKKAKVRSARYVESDTALVNRVLGREVGGKQNILVMNDEAHHAYRILREEDDEAQAELFGDDEEAEEFFREATVWVNGLDRIQRLRGINFCVDLSATPYFLSRVGQDANKPFPWVVSDFGLIDAIESGLTKIPQLVVRDVTGAAVPGYTNIWDWILRQLTPAERGGGRGAVKPEAVLKYAHTPIAMLAGLWQKELEKSREAGGDTRPPVFIIVCKNTALAKVIYEWLAEDHPPTGIPTAKIEGFKNDAGRQYTIRVDSKVVAETDDLEGTKSNESRWLRFTLDTVGRLDWPRDSIGRPVYPEGFEELAEKLERPLHPPGRDVRAIVSVSMLTEGWDCNTVTHIVGLRPFMSQLLCEQVVGRGLRRMIYEPGPDGKLPEETAKIFGVPFQVVPFKASPQGPQEPPPKRHHVRAVPEKAKYEIQFPRVEGFTRAVLNRVSVDWSKIAPLPIDPARIPPEVEMKGLSYNNQGRLSLNGPGRLDEVSLKQFRETRRLQEVVFELAGALTRDFASQPHCDAPAHVLFPQLARIVGEYVNDYVQATPPADKKDVYFSPYYGWAIERLLEAIRPATADGQAAEVPRYEANRGPGSTADVDFWTSRDVYEVVKSHVNYVVPDTLRWEQSAAYYIDRHANTKAFVKNAGLGFYIPYLHNGQRHDYTPDYLVQLVGEELRYVIIEVKGYDPLVEVKRQAAERWVDAVNADGQYGEWRYAIAKKPEEVNGILADAFAVASAL